MMNVSIDCRGLTKNKINDQIGKACSRCNDLSLIIWGYEYENLESIILPNSITSFNCSRNKIKTFFGLKLDPSSLREFHCIGNQITRFDGLTLPNSLKIFNCSHNKITSFDELTLPNSLKILDCSLNKITSCFAAFGSLGLYFRNQFLNLIIVITR